jgi:hypothetical protein
MAAVVTWCCACQISCSGIIIIIIIIIIIHVNFYLNYLFIIILMNYSAFFIAQKFKNLVVHFAPPPPPAHSTVTWTLLSVPAFRSWELGSLLTYLC